MKRFIVYFSLYIFICIIVGMMYITINRMKPVIIEVSVPVPVLSQMKLLEEQFIIEEKLFETSTDSNVLDITYEAKNNNITIYKIYEFTPTLGKYHIEAKLSFDKKRFYLILIEKN